jgi:hypothetical protein
LDPQQQQQQQQLSWQQQQQQQHYMGPTVEQEDLEQHPSWQQQYRGATGEQEDPGQPGFDPGQVLESFLAKRGRAQAADSSMMPGPPHKASRQGQYGSGPRAAGHGAAARVDRRSQDRLLRMQAGPTTGRMLAAAAGREGGWPAAPGTAWQDQQQQQQQQHQQQWSGSHQPLNERTYLNGPPYAAQTGGRPSAAGGGGVPLPQPMDPEWEQLDAVMQQPLLAHTDAGSRPPSGQRLPTWQQRQRGTPARATDQLLSGMPSGAAAGAWDAYGAAVGEEEGEMEQSAALPHLSRGFAAQVRGRPPAAAPAGTSRMLRPGGLCSWGSQGASHSQGRPGTVGRAGGLVGQGAAAAAAGGGLDDWGEEELLLPEEPLEAFQGQVSRSTPVGGSRRVGGSAAAQGMGFASGRQAAPATPSVLGSVLSSQQVSNERVKGAFMAHRQPNKQLSYRRQGNSRQTQLYWRG